MPAQLLRMRARPKILLATSYEAAEELVKKYLSHLMGVVSDVEFPREGELSSEAGFELARMIRKAVPDVPIVLQSSRTEFRERAHDEGIRSCASARRPCWPSWEGFSSEQFGFGDFVFRTPNLSEVGRATDLGSLETLLQEVPAESIAYHAERNHFSRWLTARTEFVLAQRLRPRKVSHYASVEHLRRNLVSSIADYRAEQNEVLIGDFHAAALASTGSFFLRVGGDRWAVKRAGWRSYAIFCASTGSSGSFRAFA